MVGGPERGGVTDRLRGSWRAAWPALAGYLAVRAVGLVTLGWWAYGQGIGLIHLLSTRSDAGWYLGIAQHGGSSPWARPLTVARSLARTSAPTRYAIIAFLAVGSAYFGGYLMLVWRWSP